MPSTYTASLRIEQQAAGENLNSWGEPKLNNALSRLEKGIAGRASIVLSGGTYTLTASNTTDDEARNSVLALTGASGTIIIPSVPKLYRVENAATGAATISTGAGAAVVVDPGDVVDVHCTGSAVKAVGFNNLSLKDYFSSIVLGTLSGLPAVSGNAGKFMYTDGASAFWHALVTTDISDYAADQATKTAAATGLAVAFAIAL